MIRKNSKLNFHTDIAALLTTAALFLIVFLSASDNSQAAELNAFSYVETDLTTDSRQSKSGALVNGVRQWPILINQSLKDLNNGDQFLFVSPEGTEITTTITSRKVSDNGDVMLQARLGENGLAVLTLGKDLVFGSFISDKLNLSIGVNSQGETMLVDATSVPSRSEVLQDDERYPPARKTQDNQKSLQTIEQLKTLSAQSSGKTNIDILFVHSVRFRTVFSNAQTRVNQLVSFTNAAFDRSGILIELRAVGVEEIDFDNEANVSSTLDAATNGTGDFGGVPALRNQLGADMVAVLHGNPGFSAQGVAWVNGDRDDLAFSSTRLSPGCCDAVFTHELGHNFGSGHERASVNSGASSPCNDNNTFTTFSCGHGNSANDWGTIMSRLDDEAAGFKFSNIDVACLGEACGIAPGQANEADNRTSFNMSRLLVANFRAEVNPPDPDPDPGPSPSPNGLNDITPVYLLLLED